MIDNTTIKEVLETVHKVSEEVHKNVTYKPKYGPSDVIVFATAFAIHNILKEAQEE